MEKEMTSQELQRIKPLWINVLPEIIEKYNNTTHRSIGMTPNEASINDNCRNIKHKKYKSFDKPKFTVGDKVRIQVYKPLFTKGYKQSWSIEKFTIIEARKTQPCTYKF